MKSIRLQLFIVGLIVVAASGCRSHLSSYSRMFATSPNPETMADYHRVSRDTDEGLPRLVDKAVSSNRATEQKTKISSTSSPKKAKPNVQLASYSATAEEPGFVKPATDGWYAGGTQEILPNSQTIGLPQVVGQVNCDALPIDLPSALHLAGASNWSLQIAQESVREAKARYMAANLMWLPSLQLGIGYNGHEGRIQDTQGNVVDVSRHSLFAGGGGRVGGSPIAGGSGGPLRMAVDLSLADTIFEPLARCQLVKAQQAAADSVFNDTMMETGIAYYELVRSEARVAMARQNLADAVQLVSTFNSFVEAGKGAEVDIVRAKVIERFRQQQVLEAEGQRAVAGARLARLLQLDPTKLDPQCGLTVVDSSPMPVDLVRDNDLNSLISQAISSRPEIAQSNAELCHAEYRLAAECWRPAIPHVFVGGSGGGFGGGPGTQFPDFKGRADLDVIVAWEVQNLGFGNEAMRRERNSQRRQAEYEISNTRDLIASEVSQAFFDTNARRNQIELAQMTIQDAQRSMEANVQRIRALEGSPLELIQAIESLADSRENYLNTVIEFNQSQLRLLRAVGSSM